MAIPQSIGSLLVYKKKSCCVRASDTFSNRHFACFYIRSLQNQFVKYILYTQIQSQITGSVFG